MLLLVGQRFYQGLAPLSVSEIAARLEIPAGVAKDLIDKFQSSRLVLALADEESLSSAAIPRRSALQKSWIASVTGAMSEDFALRPAKKKASSTS
jgi:hypothetical protein